MLRNILSRLIPEAIKQNSLRYYRAKNMMSVILVTSITAPIYTVIFYHLHHHRAATGILIEGLIIACSAFVLKFTKSLTLTGGLIVGSMTLFLMWLTYDLGGVTSAATFWLILPPFMAFFFRDIKTGIISGTLCVIAVSIMFWLHISQPNLTATIGPDELLLQTTSIIGLMMVILTLAYTFEIESMTCSQELYKQNKKLKLAYEEAEKSAKENLNLLKVITESEKSLETIIEGTPDAMVISDKRGFISMVNAEAEKVFGYSRDEMLGKRIEFLIPYRFHQHHISLRKSYHEIPKPRIMGAGVELFGLRKDGSEFPAEINLAPVETKQGKLILAAIRDITEKRNADNLLLEKNIQLINANLAKDQFLAHMSHELRTPLNGIIAMTQLLSSSNLPEEYKEQIDIINESEEHLLKVINHILDFSKIESGNIRVEHVEFNIHDTINRIKAIYTIKAKIKKIQFSVQINNDVPEYFKGDPVKLRQILLNLLDNAVKFTHVGQIKLSVSMQKEDSIIKYILFEVNDTGIGITPDVMPRLFAPFSQGDHSMTRKYGGTGLGLAICKNLVELMGGTIHAEPTNEGTRFYFTIPLMARSALATTTTTLQAQNKTPNPLERRNSHILLVEDNHLNQRTLNLLLQNFGYTVTLADDGTKALELLSKYPYDLVLMDCQMPNMDGYETTIEIRKRESGSDKRIPIIGVTAHAEDSNRIKCINAGMDDFIGKPFNIIELRNLILKYILN